MNIMKNNQMLLFVIVGVLLLGCGSTPKQQKATIFPVSNEVQCIEGIAGNTYRVLAWGIGHDNQSAEIDALKAAVYASLINGAAGGNCSPLMNSNERSQNSDYINKFFAQEMYWRRYVTSSSGGRIEPDKRLRLEDGRIKLGVDATVNIKNLREDLERDGVLKSMEIK